MRIDHIIRRESGMPAVFSRGQLTVIALGAVISQGIISGSGFPITVAGPAAVLSYGAAAIVAMLLMRCLSELATAHPTPGAFGSYAEAFLGRRVGFVVRSAYVLSVSGIVGTEVVMLESTLAWWRTPLPPAVVAVGVLAGINLVHLAGERMFAWLEIACVVIKTQALLALIAFACHYAFGAADFSSGAVRYAAETFIQGLHASTVWQAFSIATMGFIGLEVLSIAASQTRASRACIGRSMRSATRLVVLLVAVGVAASAWFLSYTNAPLSNTPFLFLLEVSQVQGSKLAFEALSAVTVVSVLNCQIYGGSRILFSMARAGQAPVMLAQPSKLGAASSVVTLLAILVYAAYKACPSVVYVAVSSIAITALLAIWASIFLAYFQFRRVSGDVPRGKGSWRGAVGVTAVAAIAFSTLRMDAFAPTLFYGVPFLSLLAFCYPANSRIRSEERAGREAA